jgi:hypothetical protein
MTLVYDCHRRSWTEAFSWKLISLHTAGRRPCHAGLGISIQYLGDMRVRNRVAPWETCGLWS